MVAEDYLLTTRMRRVVCVMRLTDGDGKAASDGTPAEAAVDGRPKINVDNIPEVPQLELVDYFPYRGDPNNDRPFLDPKVGRLRHWIALERSKGNANFVRDDRAHEQELDLLLRRDATQAELMMSAAVVVGSGRRFAANISQEWVARKTVELRLNGLSDADALRRDPVFGPFFKAAEAVGRDRTWRLFGGGELPPQAKWRRDPVLQPFVKLLEAVLFRVPGLGPSKDTLVIDMLQLLASTYSTQFVDEALVALNAFREDLSEVQ